MGELRPQLDHRDGRGGRGRGDRLGVLTFVTRRSTSEATKLPSPCMSYSFFCLYSFIRDARALCSMSYIAIGNFDREVLRYTSQLSADYERRPRH